MLPQNTYSSIAIPGQFLNPDDRVNSSLVDYEQGGVALNNATQGLMSYTWKCFMEGSTVLLQREGAAEITLFSTDGITELALAFDQNMQYSVAYVQNGILKLRWYDSLVANYITTVFSDARNPCLTLDDKRQTQTGNSDVLLAYIRGTTLYYRQQRDRYSVERTLRTGLFASTILNKIGMSANYRVQFELT